MSLIRENLRADIDAIFADASFQYGPVYDGVVWRKVRAATAIDPVTDEVWKAIEVRLATLDRNSYEHRAIVDLRRLTEPIIRGVIDIDRGGLTLSGEELNQTNLPGTYSRINRGWSILKLMGKPVEIDPYGDWWE